MVKRGQALFEEKGKKTKIRKCLTLSFVVDVTRRWHACGMGKRTSVGWRYVCVLLAQFSLKHRSLNMAFGFDTMTIKQYG